MLLQSQELSFLNNINNSSNINLKSTDIIDCSKKYSNDLNPKSDSNSISYVQVNFIKINKDLSSEFKKNETFDMTRSKKAIHKMSLKQRNSLKKANINQLYLFEDVNDSLSIMINMYFDKHSNLDKVNLFRNENPELKGGALLLKVLQYFEDFSFFDLSTIEYLSQDEEKKKKFLSERNNFFLRVLTSLDDKNYRVDDLVNTFIMRYTELIPEIEVDYFFLCLYGYKDKAEMLEIKHNEYFRSLLANCTVEVGKRFYKTYNPKIYLNRPTEENSIPISEVELNFVRSVLNSCVRRGFYEGIL